MTIEIRVRYAANYGEQVMLNMPITDEDGRAVTLVRGMSSTNGTLWTYCLHDVSRLATQSLSFSFSLVRAGCECCHEWAAATHRLDLNLTRAGRVVVDAVWNHRPATAAPLYSLVYTRSLDPCKPDTMTRVAYNRTLRLVVRAPQVGSAARLAMAVGEQCQGSADPSLAMPMARRGMREWQADINATPLSGSIDIRFMMVAADTTAMWDTCGVRYVSVPDMAMGEAWVVELPAAEFAVGMPELSVGSVTMSGLRSAGSCGVGDMGDLAAAVSEARAHGHQLLCLPPMCDTISTHTVADATPFSAVSVFALHPLLVDVRQLPPVADAALAMSMEQERAAINSRPLDYMAALDLKTRWLRLAFDAEADRVMRLAAFRHFFADNERWLVPYAQYCYLRDAYAEPCFAAWPAHNEWTEAERGQLSNPRTKAYKKLALCYYTQFVLHQQMQGVREAAAREGVALCCDLTANLNPNGCDLWFAMPEVDSADWWHARMMHMERYYDACRLSAAVARRDDVTELTHMMVIH